MGMSHAEQRSSRVFRGLGWGEAHAEALSRGVFFALVVGGTPNVERSFLNFRVKGFAPRDF